MAKELKFLAGTVTQGSADAFAQASIVTGLSAIGTLAFRVARIEFGFPANVEVDSNIQMVLTRKSYSAIPNFQDRSVIEYVSRIFSLTTSGFIVFDPIQRLSHSEDENLLIVEDPIYFQIDSATTSLANIGAVKVFYQEVPIKEIDRLSLISQSLS